MLVGGKDEKHTENVANPGERMQEVDSPGRVLRDEKVQQGKGHRMPGKHVVSASSNTLNNIIVRARR